MLNEDYDYEDNSLSNQIFINLLCILSRYNLLLVLVYFYIILFLIGGNLITDKCIFGNNKMFVFQDPYAAYFTGEYQIDNIEQLLTAIYRAQQRSKNTERIRLPYLVHLVEFRSKMSLLYRYEDVNAIAPLNLYGDIIFLGIPSFGLIKIDLETNDISITMDLYTFSVGGGNLEFITRQDYSKLYEDIGQECNFGQFDAHIT